MASNTRKVASIAGAWRIYLGRGVKASRAGDRQTARRELERAFELAPDEPAVLLAFGRLLAQYGQAERGATLLEQALQQRPTSRATTATLARVLGLQLGRYERAYELLRRTEGTAGHCSILWVTRGELMLAQDDLTGAETAFEAALRQRRSSAALAGLARVQNARGMQLSASGCAQAATSAFRRAARLDEVWSAPQVNLGVVLARMGQLHEALQAYQGALERDPYNPVAYYNLGIVQHELGDLSNAVRTTEQLLQICPDYPQARTSLANALVDLGEFDRAIALLLQELDLDRELAPVWSSLGLAYVCGGNVDRGEQCLRQALAVDSNHFNAYYNLAVLYATQGRKDEAEDVLRHAFRVDPKRATRALEGGAPTVPPITRLTFEEVH